MTQVTVVTAAPFDNGGEAPIVIVFAGEVPEDEALSRAKMMLLKEEKEARAAVADLIESGEVPEDPDMDDLFDIHVQYEEVVS